MNLWTPYFSPDELFMDIIYMLDIVIPGRNEEDFIYDDGFKSDPI